MKRPRRRGPEPEVPLQPGRHGWRVGRPGHALGQVVEAAYPAYQSQLAQSNAADFDESSFFRDSTQAPAPGKIRTDSSGSLGANVVATTAEFGPKVTFSGDLFAVGLGTNRVRLLKRHVRVRPDHTKAPSGWPPGLSYSG